MQIVIDILEEDYERVIHGRMPVAQMGNAIRNGIVLPKGHGRLIDVNDLKHAFIRWSMVVQGNFTECDIASIIYNSTTIIEADTKSEVCE